MAIATRAHPGRYEVCSQLGAGGMGEGYLARDTQLDRDVALKILPAEILHDQKRMRRFVPEAKAAALNHPNRGPQRGSPAGVVDIITIHEIGETNFTHIFDLRSK